MLFRGNPDKCHSIVRTNQKIEVNIGELNLESKDCEKLFEVKIDNKLTFDWYVSDNTKKLEQRLMH